MNGTSNCWHIGNSSSCDMMGAISSNWNAILLDENADQEILKPSIIGTNSSVFIVKNILFTEELTRKNIVSEVPLKLLY